MYSDSSRKAFKHARGNMLSGVMNSPRKKNYSISKTNRFQISNVNKYLTFEHVRVRIFRVGVLKLSLNKIQLNATSINYIKNFKIVCVDYNLIY